MTLSVAMIISLFQSDMLRTFADAEETTETPVLGVPEDVEPVVVDLDYPIVYVKNNQVTLYEDFVANASGAIYTGAQGEQIQLAKSYTYTVGEENVVLYQYTYQDFEGVMHTAYHKGYAFISADDISFDVVEKPETTPVPTPEVTASPEITPNPTPEVIPTATPGATQAPEGETITLDFVPNDPYANSVPATEKYAVINDTTIRVYKSPDYQAEGVELTVNAGTVIELVTAYTYSDGQVVYRYDYNGVENSALYNAALSELSGYPIIPAKYIMVGVETVENTTITDPDTSVSVTGLLPKTAELDAVLTTTAELPEGTDTTDINENALFYDFTLSNGGAYFEPSSTVKVTFPEKNLNFAQGTEYTIYHVADNGEVTTLGTEIYAGGDIQVDVNGFSYIGLSADVEFVDIEDFKAQFKVNPVTLYADTALKYGKEFTTADTDIITIEMKAIVSDGNNEVELYVISYNGYEGENSEMKEAITPSSGMAYAYVKVEDIKEYKEPIQDEPELKDTTLVDEDTGITVSGSLPIGTTLSIKEVSLESTGLDTTIYPVGEHSMVYDISLTYNGEEYQPEGEVTVKIPEAKIPFDFNTGYMLYHIAEDGAVEVKGPYVYTGGFINRYVEHFSHFVYTDVFEKAEITYEKQGFKDNDVVIYEAPFEGATTHTVDNGLDHVIYAEFIFTDRNGVTWYKFFNDTFDGLEEEYYFVKSTELVLRDKYTGVLVSGDIPDGVTLSVTEKTVEETGLDTNIYDLSGNSLFFDVTLTQNDEEYQPENGVTVTVPESNVNLENGSSYLVYHIHNGIVELQGPFVYEGGEIDLQFSNLSIVGYSESTDAINMIELYGTPTITDVTPEMSATLIDDVTLYDTYQDSVYTANITGVAGQPILIYEKVTFSNSDIVLYHYYYAGEESSTSDMCVIMQTYGFVSSECITVEEELPDIPVLEDSVVADETTGIKVYGYLPVGIKLNVTKKSVADITLDTTTYPLGTNSIVYDISLTYKGIEYQPESEVSIKLPESEIPFEFNSGYVMYHIHGEGENATIETVGPYVYTDGFINKHVDSFSTFVFTDVYPEAKITYKKAEFKSNNITIYENPVDTSATHIVDNALDHVIYVEFIFTDTEGNTWYKFYNDTFETLGEEYYFVKAEAVSRIYDVKYPVIPVKTELVETEKDVQTYSSDIPSLASFYNMYSIAIADDNIQLYNTEPTDTDGNGLIINKTVSGPTKDVYTIKLEAYVTGNVTVSRTSLPTDIVLVLDQSGSMAKAMGGKGYFVAQGTAQEIYTGYDGSLYMQVGTEYKEVTITPLGEQSYTYQHYTYRDGWQNKNGLMNYNAYKEYSDNIYYLVDGEYYQVTVNTKQESWSTTYTYTYERDTDGDGELETVDIGTSSGWDTVPNFSSNFYRRSGNDQYSSYTYSYTGADGTTVSETYTANQNITAEGYVYKGEDNRSRLEVLQEAVQSFVEGVYQDALGADNTLDTDDDINHRVAIVGFSNYSNYGSYSGSDLFIGETTYNYSTTASTQYGNAMQDMDTAAGIANVRATVGYDINGDGDYKDANEVESVLKHYGATYVDLGLEMANGILAAEVADTTYVENGKTIRNKVVIVFTDGAPGYSGNWNTGSYDSTDKGNAGFVAAEALQEANIIKNTHGATVYTIGIFGGADHEGFTIDETNKSVTLTYEGYSETAGESGEDAEANANRYMHYLSSNYTPNAATTPNMDNPGTETFPRDSVTGVPNGDSYYLAASDSDGLNSIFQKLSESISGSSNSSLTSSTVVKDIISPYFKLPDGADESRINVRTEKRTYDETNKIYGWEDEGKLSDAAISIDGKTIDVSGFDFKANYVATTARQETTSSTTADFYGRKLVIEIPIVVEPDFLGGNDVPTNGDLSGVYESADAEKPVEAFEIPDVDVALKTINPILEDQYIYVTNNADLDTMIAGSSDRDSYKYEYKLGDNTYNFDGENNGYVNVTYTVKDGETVVKTLTISAGATSGNWTGDSSVIEGLTADKTYTIECTITPATKGTITTGTFSSDIGNVYVFKPEITFKDSPGWLGDTITYGAGTNYTENAEVWKHSLGTVDAGGNIFNNGSDTGFDMSGTKPTVTIECDEDLGDVEDGIIVTISDIPVQATVTIGTKQASENTHYTVSHVQCDSVNDCTYRKDGTEEEFVIHVKTASLDISKEVDGADTSGEFKVKVTFSGNNFTKNLSILKNSDDASLNVTEGEGSFELTIQHGDTIKLTKLPVGTYTVTETVDINRYNTTVAVDTATAETATSASTTLSRNKESSTVAFVNILKTGSLTINKIVVMPAGFAVKTGEKFSFTVTDSNGTSKTAEITVGADGKGTVTINDLVQGEYTVEENLTVDQANLYDATYSSTDGKVTVSAGQTATATVTNTAKRGNLVITKTVVDKAENISPDKKFTVEITLTGDIVINHLTVAGADQTVPVTDGKATVSLANGEKVSFTNIPIGVTYTVTEKGVDTSYYTVSYSNETGMISADTPLVTVINTRNYGKLTITKVVKDDNGKIIPANPGETFLFTVTDGRGFKMQVVIAPDAAKPESDSVTLNNLPIGDYAVTEDTSWSYKYDSNDSTTSATTSVTVTEDGQATITNVLKTDKWLKADAYVENVFNPVVSTDSTAD